MYGGGHGGGGGGQVGWEVVRRLMEGKRSSDGACEDDEELELGDGHLVVVCNETWARLLVLTNEGNSCESGSVT